MACREDDGGLRVNIKVNNENLLPTTRKFNTGSLRVPADPSWPKIPQRRLADDAGDVIEPPCVITLTGSTCMARTIVRPLHPQPVATEPQNAFLHRPKISANATNAFKRRPGCIDPRFKKVTIVKSQAAPNERLEGREHNDFKEISRSALDIPEQAKSFAEKVEKTVPERDVANDQRDIQDESRKSENLQNLKKAVEAGALVHAQTFPATTGCNVSKSDEIKDSVPEKLTVPNDLISAELDESRQLRENDQDTREENEKQIAVEGCDVELNHCGSAPSEKDRNGQIFVMINENAQSLPIGAIKIDQLPIANQQYATQYYNLHVPILTYQNVPMQISPQIQSQVNTMARLTDANGSEGPIRDEIQKEYRSVHTAHPTNSVIGEKSIVAECAQAIQKEKNNGVQDACLSSIEREMPAEQNEGFSNASRNKEVPIPVDKQYSNETNIFVPRKNHSFLKNEQCLKNTRNDANVSEHLDNNRQYKSESQRSNSEISASKTSTCCRLNHKDDPNSCKTRVEMDRANQAASREDTLEMHGNQGSYGNVPVARRELKSDECLARTRSTAIGKPCRVSNSRISTNRRKMNATRSKKAKSFFQRKCQSTMPDSDCTLIWPGYQRVKQKRSQYYLHKIIGQRGDRCHGMKQYAEKKKKKNKSKAGSSVSVSHAPNSKKALYAKFYRDSLRRNTATESDEDFKGAINKVADSPTSNTEELVENPTTIPFETQQLLNKSYWEYYNKLRSRIDAKGNLTEKYSGQISMGAPQLKRRKPDDMKNFQSHGKLSLPEIRTLEQCTVLSSMINNTLDTDIPQTADTSRTKQLYLNGNIKSSSDPTAGTRSAIIRKVPSEMPKKVYDDSLPSSSSVNNKNKYIEETVDNRLLNLKTVVFLGSVMYILIVFLPMIYDYLFFEEYDHYEDLGYAEFAIEYILSSFQEAFGGVFDIFGKIFFRTRTCTKCKTIA